MVFRYSRTRPVRRVDASYFGTVKTARGSRTTGLIMARSMKLRRFPNSAVPNTQRATWFALHICAPLHCLINSPRTVLSGWFQRWADIPIYRWWDFGWRDILLRMNFPKRVPGGFSRASMTCRSTIGEINGQHEQRYQFV